MAKKKMVELRKQVRAVAQRCNDDLWVLAEVLHRVYQGCFYHMWGFESWSAYLKSDLPEVKVRKAQYLVATWDWYSRLPTEAQELFRKKWPISVLRMMGRFITDENWREWAARRPMTADDAEYYARGS